MLMKIDVAGGSSAPSRTEFSMQSSSRSVMHLLRDEYSKRNSGACIGPGVSTLARASYPNVSGSTESIETIG